ncbi:MAG: glycosyltransferase family 2 protein [Desulfopila sp.]|jgi:glycosyltransferase involved in cell wall biosynthesis|nr:glycosyltransferase family 2 protein [Desulfopila sp.]
MNKSISVVMPVYNEVATISKTVHECNTKILAHFSMGEIIVVDDKSTDGSLALLEALSSEVSSLRVLRNSQNLGHGPSLLRAIGEATGEYVFCIDSDYQHLPGDFWLLFSKIEKADVVIGLRSQRQDPVHRKILSRLANSLIRLIFNCSNKDLNVPFKLFRRTDLQAILPLLPGNAYIPSTLAVLAAHTAGFSIEQVSVTHLPRNSGTSSFLGWHLLFFCTHVLRELLWFRVKKWNNIRTLRSQP